MAWWRRRKHLPTSSTASTRKWWPLNLPDVKDTLFKQGIEAAPGTPEEFGAYIKSEISKWHKVVLASGAKAN